MNERVLLTQSGKPTASSALIDDVEFSKGGLQETRGCYLPAISIGTDPLFLWSNASHHRSEEIQKRRIVIR